MTNASRRGHCAKDPETGLYHGYFSFLLGHCPLAKWKTNSAIVHAVAGSPEGPYKPQGRSLYPPVPGVMIPPWAHSAFVTFSKIDGQWLLWHIGPADTPPSAWENCSVAEERPLPSEDERHTCTPPPCGENMYVSTAPSLSGPWSTPPVRLRLTDAALNNSWWSSTTGNQGQFQNNPSMPAPFIFENGTTLLFYQAKNCPAGWGNLAPACVGVLRASHWRGPYSEARTTPIIHPESEDPFVFRTARGFHLLVNINTYHKRCPAGVACGGHAWSDDGLSWSPLQMAAFGPTVTLSNGSAVRNSYVERPQVYLDEADGQPRTLFVGLTRPDGYADSVTWAQRFCREGEAGCGTTVGGAE